MSARCPQPLPPKSCLEHHGVREGPAQERGQHRIDNDGGLASLVTLLWEYHGRLQKVVPWPIAVLPPLADDVPQRHVEMEIRPSDE